MSFSVSFQYADECWTRSHGIKGEIVPLNVRLSARLSREDAEAMFKFANTPVIEDDEELFRNAQNPSRFGWDTYRQFGPDEGADIYWSASRGDEDLTGAKFEKEFSRERQDGDGLLVDLAEELNHRGWTGMSPALLADLTRLRGIADKTIEDYRASIDPEFLDLVKVQAWDALKKLDERLKNEDLTDEEYDAEFDKWVEFYGWVDPIPPPPGPAVSDATAVAPCSLGDFVAYMPAHSYIFIPIGEMWPSTSVNSRIPPISVPGRDKPIAANAWLDINRPVEQMTWAPGKETVIRDRLIADGGWIERSGCNVFNLYRAPVIRPAKGDASAR